MKISRSLFWAIGLHKLDFRFWLYMNTQLPLFENSPAVGTLYRVGDLLKLKRKTPHTAGLKKGDIVKIEGIHPLDGSCKFWNELTESWGYLYPGEFALLPANKIDSVTVDVEPVVTESNPPTIDSVTVDVEPVVTESNPPTIDSVTKFASSISTYRPRGTARSGEYFRFSYRDGGKVRHIHIKGGNTDSPIAQAKVQEVRSLLAAGASPLEVAATLSPAKE
ncbi:MULTISPECIES: hypothetical protein [unclassified Microcoleus]|uniref:hypothetical protein n=1 Tax=unclassified Microcoleus TaxID=2642155 RepID=UPI0025EC43DA|nr:MULTISPECIES: hypothetical protein [unclassified Microcoleus]